MLGMGTAIAPFRLGAVPERESRRSTAALASAIAAAGGVACALSMAAPVLHGLPLHPLDQIIHTGRCCRLHRRRCRRAAAPSG